MRDIIINEILIPSLQKLYKVDYDNIKFDVSERNVCARLAHHIENRMRKYDKENQSNRFRKYYADVEYNRMRNGDIKQYEDSRKIKQKMVSDLLIQSRGIERNLLAVELKKTKNKDQRDENRDRLESIVKSFGDEDCVHGTLVGAFIIYSPKEVMIEIYENRDGRGEMTDKKHSDMIQSEENS